MSALKYRLTVVAHYRAVYRLAYALLRQGADAEDVTQDTFVRYWELQAAVERPREWLLKVARNSCLDRLRRVRRLPHDPIEAAGEPADDCDPVWHLQQAELKSRLDGAVDALPEPYRSLVVLFDRQGLDGASCARILDLNVNQVKVYLHRARRRLRAALEQPP